MKPNQAASLADEQLREREQILRLKDDVAELRQEVARLRALVKRKVVQVNARGEMPPIPMEQTK